MIFIVIDDIVTTACFTLQAFVFQFADRVRARGYRSSRASAAKRKQRVQRDRVDHVVRKAGGLHEGGKLLARTGCSQIRRQPAQLRAHRIRQTPQHAEKL